MQAWALVLSWCGCVDDWAGVASGREGGRERGVVWESAQIRICGRGRKPNEKRGQFCIHFGGVGFFYLEYNFLI